MTSGRPFPSRSPIARALAAARRRSKRDWTMRAGRDGATSHGSGTPFRLQSEAVPAAISARSSSPFALQSAARAEGAQRRAAAAGMAASRDRNTGYMSEWRPLIGSARDADDPRGFRPGPGPFPNAGEPAPRRLLEGSGGPTRDPLAPRRRLGAALEVAAAEGIAGRIRAARLRWRREGRLAEEEDAQDLHGVAHVDAGVVVRIGGLQAG